MIDRSRLLADLDALAAIAAPGTPGVTRVAFTPAFDEGRRWLRARFEEAGLRTFVDAGGNLLGLRAASEARRPILIGSHSDTVHGGGRYDGALGVLAALEVARALRDHPLRHGLWVCDYLAEEATDYGVACLGSQALAGLLPPGALALRGPDGRSVAEALRAVGGDPDLLAGARLAPGGFAAALELHIEQGPRMERAGARLAAVSGIVGIRRARLLLTGQPDHAGTTPMEARHDALAAAAAVILRLEALARATPEAIATVGRIEARPNQGNVVPASVALGAEIRSLHPPVIAQIWEALLEGAEAECAARGVALALEGLEDAPPALPPPWLFELVRGVCRRLDPRSLELPSGAGHDTGYLAAIGPAAMIFVPSVGGRSHCPEEHTGPDDLALGAQALLEAVLAVDATRSTSADATEGAD
jgi:N-carbamoyl-L-amino-acid hydrolase